MGVTKTSVLTGSKVIGKVILQQCLVIGMGMGKLLVSHGFRPWGIQFFTCQNPYPRAVPVPMCCTHTLFGLYIPHRTIKIYNYCFILWYSDKDHQQEWVRVVWHNHLHVGCHSHLPLPSTTHLHLCNHTQIKCICVTCSVTNQLHGCQNNPTTTSPHCYHFGWCIAQSWSTVQ